MTMRSAMARLGWVKMCPCVHDDEKIPTVVRSSDGSLTVHGVYPGVDVSRTEAFDRPA